MNFDKDFIEKLVKRDQLAFNEFYLKTIDIFSRYLNSNYFLGTEKIEDILSEFYIKWRNVCDKYDNTQCFSSFVWTVFKNLVKDYLKKQKDMPFTYFDDNEDGTKFEDNIVDEFDISELLEKEFELEEIESAMKNLSEDYREIIYLKFIECKDNDDIAKILGISNDNVRQKISRALKSLKSLLS